jgi:WhiB family transcriptional regulator, redox-sensing transcriptional regulator
VAISRTADLQRRGPRHRASRGIAAKVHRLAFSDDLEPSCRADPDLWFAESPAELELAKSLCGECRVRASCLAGALARREPWGVWGGEIFEHGQIVARKRPRGRPRKADREPAA